MKRYLAIAVAMFLTAASIAQTSTVSGAGLLFHQVKTKLTAAEKHSIYHQLGFLVSDDGKRFIADEDAADYPFDAMVYPTDLNGDGQEEIFVVFGNGFTSGATGSTVVLFIKDAKGKYQSNLGFPGVLPEVIGTTPKPFPDLLIGGSGFEFPVWKWQNGEYVFSRSVKEADLKKLKLTPVETLYKKYIAGL